MQPSLGEHVALSSPDAQVALLWTGQEGADLRMCVPDERGHVSLRDDATAVRTRARAHFDDPIGGGEDLRVVVDQHDGIAVGNEVAHHAGQTDDIGGVKADGGFVQHIEDAGGAVAHGARKLHALAFPGGERGGGAVERQIAKAQFHQSLCHRLEGSADALRHGAHGLRQRRRHVRHPIHQFRERHPAGGVQRDAAQLRQTRRRESRVPPQSGHVSCFRKRSTRFMPFSSLTLAARSPR